MTRGVVTNLRATVNIPFLLPGQPHLMIEFDVDTGFQGALALPPEAVNMLGLPFVMEVQTILVSGDPRRANLHHAMIKWEGRELLVPVLAMGIRPLLGVALLRGHDLHIEYEEGGEVRVEPRP